MAQASAEIQVCERSVAMHLWYNTCVAGRLRRGQALLEYVLSLAALLVVVAILWGLIDVALRYADRTESYVSSDYP